MRVIATIYTLVLVVASSWDWATLLFENPAEEHLLPGLVFYFVSMPSSLLMEMIVNVLPSVLHNVIAFQLIWTVLGALQVAAVWFVALRFKSQ